MRIRRSKIIPLVQQDRRRRIDFYIDYFGAATTGPSLLAVSTPASVRWEQTWSHRLSQSRDAG